VRYPAPVTRTKRDPASARTLRTLTALVLLALALGCDDGTGDATTPATPAIDACVLLTLDDAAAVLGRGTGRMSSFAEDELGRDPSSCAYSSGATTPPDVLSLQVRRHRSPERAERALRSVASFLRAEPVPGLGDGACFGNGQLHVRKGPLQITVTVHAAQVADPYAAAVQLAGKALARLDAGAGGTG
jgi:hypothetical protein